ncbi:MAG: ABC transporter ATP-binding protein [Deltaproteobacteria bacterium]
MQAEYVIRARGLGKCYHIYDRPQDRLKQFLARGRKRYFREFWAIRDLDFDIRKGEVVGIIGRNGAGKSTLLQLVCGTLTPTCGSLETQGRVAALLELGAGFNPEFTGRENVFMNAAILGLSQEEIEKRYDEIVAFSGIGEFIDQPVKTYSSGMFVRLAFSVATSVDPDILVIDEALSVGDGAFARKSFDRIMAMKKAGKTILFCSHSMYYIEALCQRAIWLENGRMRLFDSAERVTNAYSTELIREQTSTHNESDPPDAPGPAASSTPTLAESSRPGRIISVQGACDGKWGRQLHAISRKSTISFAVEFALDPSLPPPTVAVAIENAAGILVTSASTANEGLTVAMGKNGRGHAAIVFPEIPLLKGEYRASLFLACENGLHVYDHAPHAVTIIVTQEDIAQGIVDLPHRWQGCV